MKSHWKKLGQLYCPAETGRHPKLATHAANPLPLWLEGDVYRVFYSSRDACNRSSVGAVDIDIVQRRVVCDHAEPFLVNGAPGSYYADGISIGCCYETGGTRYMLFMGWQANVGTHWRGDIGRIIVNDDLTLRADGDQPFIGSDATDPLSLSYPWVIQDAQGRYAMWYGSTLTWDAGNGEMLHVIHAASSTDGTHWTRHGLSVPYELGTVQAFSRPTVASRPGGGLDMWFSCRGATDKYRIGRAISEDGTHWRLAMDEAGIAVSEAGWDSDMIEYPYVFDHDGKRYMLYNGNGYGRTGFGLAQWIED